MPSAKCRRFCLGPNVLDYNMYMELHIKTTIHNTDIYASVKFGTTVEASSSKTRGYFY